MPDAQELTAIQDKRDRDKQTPLIARCAGVDLRSAIAPADITGVLFHQASYEYALPLETELPDADYETVAAERQIRVNREQQGGEWLDADALHLTGTANLVEQRLHASHACLYESLGGLVMLCLDTVLCHDFAASVDYSENGVGTTQVHTNHIGFNLVHNAIQ